MKRLAPLALLTLAACDPPLQELFPPNYYDLEHDGIVYLVGAQYDPFERGWFTRIQPLAGEFGVDDLDLALLIVEQRVGPFVCDGDPLDVEPGRVWSGFGASQIVHLEELGAWQFVGRCV